ncbi:class I SAM-dependent methyltransferase [Maridesulfovibrio salexigens]|uniref:Methyltransferase type 12 n=1 Tax=Maridesulfovibrio salexigens (strain ATCC 14822 / DSM 2638 / NCIMB 8403 / VKM B-1763) TaxID=526222 RepID=C6BUX5_MARSD|nr:class I SAM-dependent methyltransferase [Maridesulfovibrio salexigens]ACS78112.1 Methyltransferase type 12 [Maridesulfovibrio salexigens DSM 2638]
MGKKNNRIEIDIAGKKILKHVRDIAKDNIIKKMLPSKKPAKILETSAGEGILALELKSEGHDLTITNFVQEGAEGLHEVKVDLNAADYEIDNGPFDAIICREVIEHIESVPHTLRMFHKHLSPGGTLILTFPNRLCLRSRAYHFFTGFYRGMPSPINLDLIMGEEHINLIGYPEMDYFLRKTGYNIEEVTSSEIRKSDKAWLIFKPLIWLATTFFILFHKKNREGYEKVTPEQRKANTFVRDVLLSTPALCGKDIVIKATKK